MWTRRSRNREISHHEHAYEWSLLLESLGLSADCIPVSIVGNELMHQLPGESGIMKGRIAIETVMRTIDKIIGINMTRNSILLTHSIQTLINLRAGKESHAKHVHF